MLGGILTLRPSQNEITFMRGIFLVMKLIPLIDLGQSRFSIFLVSVMIIYELISFKEFVHFT